MVEPSHFRWINCSDSDPAALCPSLRSGKSRYDATRWECHVNKSDRFFHFSFLAVKRIRRGIRCAVTKRRRKLLAGRRFSFCIDGFCHPAGSGRGGEKGQPARFLRPFASGLPSQSPGAVVQLRRRWNGERRSGSDESAALDKFIVSLCSSTSWGWVPLLLFVSSDRIDEGRRRVAQNIRRDENKVDGAH